MFSYSIDYRVVFVEKSKLKVIRFLNYKTLTFNSYLIRAENFRM